MTTARRDKTKMKGRLNGEEMEKLGYPPNGNLANVMNGRGCAHNHSGEEPVECPKFRPLVAEEEGN